MRGGDQRLEVKIIQKFENQEKISKKIENQEKISKKKFKKIS